VNPAIRYLQTADGLRIACAEHGEGPPLVYVRAWISNIELMWTDPAYRAYFEALGRHYRVIRYDMRGNGLSERDIPPITLDAMLGDLEAVMDEYAATEPAVLYGQCFGGPTAIAYGAQHPERISHLVLDGTYADGRQITSQRRAERIVNTLRDQPEAGLMLLAHYTTPNQTRDRFRDTDEVGDSISPATAAELYAHGFKVDVRDYLSQLTVPVLVMHRRDTRAVTMRLGADLARAIAGARFVPIDGVAHNLWDEAPELALRALGEFLDVPLETPGAKEATGARERQRR
jgi:pimeloyl-ACP methyl ester carboxylesterase